MSLRSKRWPLVAALLLGCGWIKGFIQEPPPIERTVVVPFAEPGRVDLVSLRGAWLHAAEIAFADYFSGMKAPPDPTALEACLLRRENYDVVVWEQREEPADAGSTPDAGEAEEDAGHPDGGMTGDLATPRLLFVTIVLHPEACDLGESPPLDTGANYAIDTTDWKIVGWRP